MDNETVLPKQARLNPYGKAVRRERIFARLRLGWTYEDIAGRAVACAIEHLRYGLNAAEEAENEIIARGSA